MLAQVTSCSLSRAVKEPLPLSAFSQGYLRWCPTGLVGDVLCLKFAETNRLFLPDGCQQLIFPVVPKLHSPLSEITFK